MPFYQTPHINMHYQIHGEGDPVVFVHGLGSSIRDWEQQIEFFAKHHQVIAMDIRGHGLSSKPQGNYSVGMLADDVIDLLDGLLPSQAFTLVGHSLGGMISYDLVLKCPERVKRLVIINSYPAVVFASQTVQFYFWLRKWLISLRGMHALSQHLATRVFPEPHQKKLREQFIERWDENDPKAYLQTLSAFPGWSVMDQLPRIHCPTLLICADKDYTPVRLQKKLLDILPHASMVVIEKSHHMTPLDQPQALNQALEDFISHERH